MSKKSKEGAYVGHLKFLSRGNNRTKEDFSAEQSKKKSFIEHERLSKHTKKCLQENPCSNKK